MAMLRCTLYAVAPKGGKADLEFVELWGAVELWNYGAVELELQSKSRS